MNTFFRITAVISVLFVLPGCCRDHPTLPQEEIACHRWIYKGNDVECTLSFEDNMFNMYASVHGGENLRLSGVYYADENNITVDSDDFGTVVFPYRAENEYLFMNYAGKEFRMQKDECGNSR